jgi:hypothetical protein
VNGQKKETIELEVEAPFMISEQCLERLKKYIVQKVRNLILKYGAAEVRIEMEVELKRRSWLEELLRF